MSDGQENAKPVWIPIILGVLYILTGIVAFVLLNWLL